LIDSTLSTFTATDGENLAVQDWPLDEEQTLRGVVLIVHGLGEHAGRYDRLARRLNEWGFAVRGFDQYGHGESGGTRGALPSPNRLVNDLADMVDSVRGRTPDGIPLIVLGHSMGGLVAAMMVALRPVRIDGLVLSSPALQVSLGRMQKFLLKILPRVAPNIGVRNRLDPNGLSHDPDVVNAYKADPLVHDRITPRLARFVAVGGPRVVRRAERWKTPTLLLYAGSDVLVDPQGSRKFAANAPAQLVTAVCFDELYHEIFNELEAEPVYEALWQWLDARF
jgi:alpha-beta hydrolase superfamily lysophospholipase